MVLRIKYIFALFCSADLFFKRQLQTLLIAHCSQVKQCQFGIGRFLTLYLGQHKIEWAGALGNNNFISWFN